MKKEEFTAWERCKFKIIGILGKYLINLLFLTIRLDNRISTEVQQMIDERQGLYAFWHSRLLLIDYYARGMEAMVLISQSKDGEVIAQIFKQQGNIPVRGSSTRGGVRALVKVLRLLREKNRICAITPDGPQGPRFRVQPGVILLAQKMQIPIIPIGASASRVKIFNSWDRFMLPLPFSKYVLMDGHPVWVPANADEKIIRQKQLELEVEMNRITQLLDQEFSCKINPA